jgi:hypothetical protein
MGSADPVAPSGGTTETAVAALRRLGSEHKTGVLEISGPLPGDAAPGETLGPPTEPVGPRGWIYFVDGAVAYAEAPAVPGVDVRLVRCDLRPGQRPVPAQPLNTGQRDWHDLVELTRAAALSDADLELIVRSATADAVVSVLGRAHGARCRFRPGLERWPGRCPHVAVDELLDEAVAGLEMIAASRVGPDDTVALGPAGSEGVVLAPSSMSVLIGLARGRTPRQAAWHSGAAVLDAVATLSDLVGQGACAVVTRRPRPCAPPPLPAEPVSSWARPTPDQPPLVRRRPQRLGVRPAPEPAIATTDAAVLTRLIEAVRSR